MNRRPPMSPPDIRGFRFERLLGSGGYSDVFLYEQEMPRRPVAIKVLIADRLDDRSLRLVADEANAMAAVSTHPYIVTIFHADVGSGGNPYMVMEYYPRPNYSQRARNEQIPVAEVLRAGVQVASAVETAHRAGIIHRDIKPANILTSEYGRPGLTDFGIAGLADGSTDAAEGLSVPWSPPEIIDGDVAGDVASDVYSLGATIYSLLAGRSPFEVPGGSNSTLDLLERIKRGELPPTGRGDVPPTFERLLRHAMARRPEDRPSSAADLARALQDIEVQQQFAMTPLEVREEERGLSGRARLAPGEPDDDGTRLKSPTVIQSQSPSNTTPGAVAASTGSTADGLVAGVPAAGPEGATVQRSSLTGDAASVAGAGSSVASPFGPPPLGAVEPHVVPPGAERQRVGAAPSVASDGDAAPAGGAAVAGAAVGGRQRSAGSVLVRAAWGVLVVVVALVVVGVAVRSGSGGRESSTTTTTTGTGPTILDQLVEPPTAVVVSVDAGGRTVARWTPADGAPADVSYVVTPVGQGMEAQFPTQPAAGERSVVIPPGTTCVSVWAEGANGSTSNCKKDGTPITEPG